MSTIMKALRRLEQEKNAQTDRPLGEAVANIHSPSPARRRGLSWLVAGGSLAAVLALGAIAFLVIRPGGDAGPGDLAALAGSPPAAAGAPRAKAVEAAKARRTRPDLAERRARAEERRARAEERRALRSEPIPGDSASAKALSPAALISDVEVVERIRPAPSDADSAPVIPTPAGEKRPGAARAAPGAKPQRPVERARAAAARRRSAPQPPPSTALPPGHEPEPPAATAASSGSAPAPPPAPTTAASQSPAPEQPSSPVAVPPQSEREVTAAADPEPEQGTRSTAAAAQQEATPRPPVVAEEPEPVQVAVKIPEPEPETRAAPAPEPAPRAEPEPVRPTAAKPALILRSPVPTVYVERTIWHPVAERRVAVVEMEGREELLELREGDAVGPLVVGRIEPSGVLFHHDGVELRRRVGAR